MAFVDTTSTAWRNWTSTATTSATASTDVWYQWTDAGTSATSSNVVWRAWTTTTTATTTSVTTGAAEAWYRWTTETHPKRTVLQPVPAPPPPTAEELAEQRRLMAERVRQAELAAKAQEEKRAAAKARAEETLKSLLTPEQQKAWDEERVIFVTGQSGKRYRIKEGMTHNFHEVDAAGQLLKEFCAHVSYMVGCPIPDNVLAQFLALKFNEAMIVKKANIWDVTRRDRPMIQRSS